MQRSILLLMLVIVALTGCESDTPDPTGTSAEPSPTQLVAPMPTANGDDENPTAAPVLPTNVPFEVTYFTPAQQEGPYYPVEKPDDRDNDLFDLAGAGERPAGEVLHLAGVVYDAAGQPVEEALIEIWQTDASGVYLHPNDPGTASRDPNFQFYGESMTGADGVYSFRTILPGRYEPRPRHIHVKVKLNGEELLTTQFYFELEASFSGEEANLVALLAPAENDAGDPIWVAERDIVLRSAQ